MFIYKDITDINIKIRGWKISCSTRDEKTMGKKKCWKPFIAKLKEAVEWFIICWFHYYKFSYNVLWFAGIFKKVWLIWYFDMLVLSGLYLVHRVVRSWQTHFKFVYCSGITPWQKIMAEKKMPFHIIYCNG